MSLEVMAAFVLGIDLAALPDGHLLHESYHYIFDPPPVVQLLTFIHTFVMPIRWFPLEANRKFVHSNKLLRSILAEVVHKRVKEVDRAGGQGVTLAEKKGAGGKDLLTFMAEQGWSEEAMLNQVLTFMAAGAYHLSSQQTSMTY